MNGLDGYGLLVYGVRNKLKPDSISNSIMQIRTGKSQRQTHRPNLYESRRFFIAKMKN